MAHVSTATILRFCRKCGADGYSEFKIKYREHLEGKRDALKDDGTAELQSFVNQAWSEDFQESIEMAFQYLRKSRCTIFIGVGSSGMLGKYGARYFSNVGRFSLFINVTGAGLPIVMNPVLAFPFIAMPVISCILQYAALYTGLCPLYGATQVPWTCPPIISGFLIGGWRTALLQLVIFVLSFFIYLPFARRVDKLNLVKEAEAEKEAKDDDW